MTQGRSLVIHSNLVSGGLVPLRVEGYAGAIAFYYYLRLLDPDGSGWADITIKEAAIALNRSVVTVKRYLKQALAHQFIASATKRSDGTIRVYYRAIHKIGDYLQLDALGATVEIGEEDLPHIKLLATQATAQALQKASRFRAKFKKKGVAKAGQILSPSSNCRGVRGKIKARGLRCVYVSEEFIPFGGSQKAIAKLLGRSERTVQRHLSKKYRALKGLPPLRRKQIAQESKESQVRLITKTNPTRCFTMDGKAYKLLCNVYSEDLHLRPQRYSRNKFKRIRGID